MWGGTMWRRGVCVCRGYSFKGVTSFSGGHLQRGEKICVQTVDVGRLRPQKGEGCPHWMWGCSWSREAVWR